MAEEKKVEGEETKETEGGAPQTGKGGKRGFIKWGIIGVAVLMVLGGGVFGYKVFSKKGGDGSGHPEKGAIEGEGEKGKPGHMIPLESFVVNLSDSSEIKYLKVTINLDVDSEKSSAEVQARMPQIRDALLMLLTSKTSDDVKDIGGKLKLQDEMVSRVNNYLKEGKVKAVYFTEFVMQ